VEFFYVYKQVVVEDMFLQTVNLTSNWIKLEISINISLKVRLVKNILFLMNEIKYS
jgi:hypothetical protein